MRTVTSVLPFVTIACNASRVSVVDGLARAGSGASWIAASCTGFLLFGGVATYLYSCLFPCIEYIIPSIACAAFSRSCDSDAADAFSRSCDVDENYCPMSYCCRCFFDNDEGHEVWFILMMGFGTVGIFLLMFVGIALLGS